ncbi:MAG: alpha/beta hydrolase [Rhodospirillales bacterium]|nr:alpha/beta hydrolase [Rhodospirillales bacterium]
MAAKNKLIYRDRDEAFFHHHFTPDTAVDDPDKWVRRAQQLGQEATAGLQHIREDVPYGDTPLQAVDVFPAADPDAPIHLYFHGGYWRSYDKANYRYIPGMLVPEGVTTILANYDLCPQVTLDEIVQQVIGCVAFVYRSARELGGDPDRLFLSGSSAGGHLAAMAINHDFAADGLPPDVIKGALSITGVHRLEPVLYIPANEDIRLDAAMASRNTTLDKVPVTKKPVLVAVGADEPNEWVRMSVDYDTMLREEGIPGDLMIVAGTHHYSVTQTLADPDSRMSRALLAMMGLG